MVDYTQETVLVFGGTGFLGKNLQHSRYLPKWRFLGRQYDLLDANTIKQLLETIKPAAILNLAASVGGIQYNMAHQPEQLYQNSMMALNLIEAAYQTGIPRVLSTISTCAWPSDGLCEDDLFNGPPAETNIAYGMAKRLLFLMSREYSRKYGVVYNTVALNNLYGPHDLFDEMRSHFVTVLIYRHLVSKDYTLLGTGMPTRQFTFVADVARLLPRFLNEYFDIHESMFVSTPESWTIGEMALIAGNIMNCEFDFVAGAKELGQLNKLVDSSKLMSFLNNKNYQFSLFKDGFEETYKWYKGYCT